MGSMSTTPTAEQPRPTVSLPSSYAPADVEGPLYERWIERGYFTAHPESDKPAYCIVIPPPNVTGSLHLGHAFQHTLMDALTRRRRMQGYEALWLPGMDHAGIATQTLVERHLAETEGKSKHDYTREDFVAKVWEWKAEYGGKILGQMRRLGDGVDWTRERFTMDEGLSRAVQTIFKRLYDDGLIYRAERIINWCPRDRTALSDIEVDHHDDEGELVSIRYGDGDARIVVATTRAETMLGDTAVAVHPDDERYAHLIGTEVELPLTGRRIPIVADEHVDPGFGTGAVKVTPAHDPNDFEIGQRHGLPSLTVLDERGVVTAPGPFEGLDRFEARPAVVAALREEGRIVAEKRPYLHAVGHCSRCDAVIEPRLSEQWFVKAGPLAKAAGDAVRDGRVTIHPASLAQRYFDWVDNMHDWCISRQLWWGHRIPVWYGPDGEMRCVGPDEEPPAGLAAGRGRPRHLVLQRALAVLHARLARGHRRPAPLLPDRRAAHRLRHHLLLGRPDDDVRPLRDGRRPAVPHRGPHRPGARQVRQEDEQVARQRRRPARLDGPVRRPTPCASPWPAAPTPGTDVPISAEWVEGSRNFCTKLWNATRFALLNGATVQGDLPPASEQSVVDRWILSRLATVTAQVDAGYEDFQFAKTTDALYHFVWDEVCDWYLEFAKQPLRSSDEGMEAARPTSPGGCSVRCSTSCCACCTR